MKSGASSELAALCLSFASESVWPEDSAIGVFSWQKMTWRILLMPSQLLQGVGVGFSGPDSSQSIALVNLILSGVVVVLLILALPWRRLRWPVPMPWNHGRSVRFRSIVSKCND